MAMLYSHHSYPISWYIMRYYDISWDIMIYHVLGISRDGLLRSIEDQLLIGSLNKVMFGNFGWSPWLANHDFAEGCSSTHTKCSMMSLFSTIHYLSMYLQLSKDLWTSPNPQFMSHTWYFHMDVQHPKRIRATISPNKERPRRTLPPHLPGLIHCLHHRTHPWSHHYLHLNII